MRESGVDLSVFRMSAGSDMTAREWSVQFEGTKAMILTKRKNGEVFNRGDMDALRGNLLSLGNHLQLMTKNPMAYEISLAEISRRQVVLDNLLSSSLTGGAPSLRSSQSGSGAAGTNRGSVATSAATVNPMLQSDKMMMERQKQIFKEQDEMLGDIGKGLDRLKDFAITIGDEAKGQTRMLGELDGNVDEATAALQSETKHASLIKEQSRVCWMYICIAVQVVIIILLLLVAYA